jgi:hypothetical protein
MIAIGMGMAWVGYSFGLWGYCLIRGFNVKLTDLMNPVHPYSGPWPPAQDIPAGDILPGQTSTGSSSSARQQALSGSPPVVTD